MKDMAIVKIEMKMGFLTWLTLRMRNSSCTLWRFLKKKEYENEPESLLVFE